MSKILIAAALAATFSLGAVAADSKAPAMATSAAPMAKSTDSMAAKPMAAKPMMAKHKKPKHPKKAASAPA